MYTPTIVASVDEALGCGTLRRLKFNSVDIVHLIRESYYYYYYYYYDSLLNCAVFKYIYLLTYLLT